VLDTDKGEFYVWRPSLAKQFSEGQTTLIRYRDGDYPRVTGIIEAEKLPSKPKVEEKRKEIPAEGRDQQINRAVALKVAAEVVTKTVTPDVALGTLPEKILQIAEIFEAWLNRKKEG